MRLTDQEKRMYQGGYGEIIAKAMDYIVKFGEACDSGSMVDIGYAHVHPGLVILRNDVSETLELAESGARVVVPTSVNLLATDIDQWQTIGAPESFARQQISVLPAHRKMGIAGTYSCTPYLAGYLPPKGTHIASIESSAVIYFNSMLGARSNRDGPFAIYAAFTGKYPLCGYHLKENRMGSHLVHVETSLTSPTDYGALGFCIGERVGGGVPVITGLGAPSLEDIIALGSAMATSGQVALYHIPGVTAECQEVEDVITKGAGYEEFAINASDIRSVYEKLYTAEDNTVDFVNLGCPHYTLEQVRQVAGLIEGHKVHNDVRLWVFTSRSVKALADRMGYSEVIKNAGGLVISDCCGTCSHLRQTVGREYNLTVPAVNNMITDSVKQAKYCNSGIGCRTILSKLENCIEAAVTGKGAL